MPNPKEKITPAAKQRMKELHILLEGWKYARYYLKQQLVPLEIYDQHFQELLELERRYEVVLPGSPTQTVGFAPSTDLPVVTRTLPMLSLDSVANFEDLEKWKNTLEKKLGLTLGYVGEWKIDGLSLSVIYKNSKLFQISTRGDGYQGEDVTLNRRLIVNLPDTLPLPGSYEVRGEVYMTRENFEKINQELRSKNQKPLSNPRNAAAGTIQSLVAEEGRELHFFAYQLLGKNLQTQIECLEVLQQMNFAVSPHFFADSLEEIQNQIEKREEERKFLDFESDGVVLKVNDYAHYPRIGRTSRFPHWAIAYKFSSSLTYSKIEHIEIEVSKNGRITYVAHLRPVFFQGSTISRVNLHNFSFIQENEINIGDEVVLKKAGDVIPQVVEIIKIEKGVWEPPQTCPSCRSPLLWSSSKIFQLCPTTDCPQKLINYLVFFSSKRGMDIKGVSKQMIKKLFESGLLRTPKDFYHLKNFRESILSLEGVKEKTLENILNSVEISKKRGFSNLLTALSIPLLSEFKARIVTTQFATFEALITALEENKWLEFEELVGSKTQAEIKKFWQDPAKKRELLELREIFSEKS